MDVDTWAFSLAVRTAKPHGWRASDVYAEAVRARQRGVQAGTVELYMAIVSDSRLGPESFAETHARVRKIAAEMYEQEEAKHG